MFINVSTSKTTAFKTPITTVADDTFLSSFSFHIQHILTFNVNYMKYQNLYSMNKDKNDNRISVATNFLGAIKIKIQSG